MKRRISPSALQRYVDDLKRQIAQNVEASLSLDAARVIVVDSDPTSCWNLTELTRTAFGRRSFLVHRARDPRAALECPFRDVWLAVVRDRSVHDAVDLCRRLRGRYAHVRIVAMVRDAEPSSLGPLAATADWLCPDQDAVAGLRVCATATSMFRRYLPAKIVHARVTQHVIATFGDQAARRVGLATPPQPVTTAEAGRATLIRQALRASAGNCTNAAQLLGVSRSTLYRWLDTHNIDTS